MGMFRKYKGFYLLNAINIYLIPFLFLIISESYYDFLIISATFLVPLGCFILGIVFGIFCKAANDLPFYAITVSLLIFPTLFVPNLAGSSFGDKLFSFGWIYSYYFVLTVLTGVVGLLLRAVFSKLRTDK